MNAYGWGQGYIAPTQNNYVSTDPSYDPYSADTGLSSGNNSMWGSIISGIGSYAGAQSSQDASAEQAKMSAEAKKELLAQQRGYDLEDRKYKQEAVSKWSRYFG